MRVFSEFKNALSRPGVPESSDQGIIEFILLAKDLLTFGCKTRQSFHLQQIQHFPEASESQNH